MWTIEKITTQARSFKQRMAIRRFKYSEDMHKFLNKGSNALSWKESKHDLKSGTYLYAGGKWLNVKDCDSLTLCHC